VRDTTVDQLVAFGAAVLLVLGLVLLLRRVAATFRHRSLPTARLLRNEPQTREARPSFFRRLFSSRKDREIEQAFRNVFFTAADRGEGLIEYYQRKHGCGRVEAMQRAIEGRRRDETRFD
jgi:hypothetical protein